MSHHPSSADLAAFRASLMAATGAAAAADPDHFLRRYRTGAAPWERRDGIGYRIPTDRYLSSLYGPHARREAAAMRSRAFEAARCPACGVPNIPDGPGCRCYGD